MEANLGDQAGYKANTEVSPVSADMGLVEGLGLLTALGLTLQIAMDGSMWKGFYLGKDTYSINIRWLPISANIRMASGDLAEAMPGLCQ